MDYNWGDDRRQQFEDLERELTTPIQVVRWSAERDAERMWVTGYESEGFTAEDSRERGIRVWIRGVEQAEGRRHPSALTVVGQHYTEWMPDYDPVRPIVVDGTTIGEIGDDGQSVYVFLDMYSQDQPDEVMQAIYDAIRECCDPAAVEARAAAEQELVTEKLRELGQRTYSVRVSAVRTKIDACLNTAAIHREAAVLAMRQVQEHQKELDALLHLQEHDAAEQMIREWEQLKAHPRLAHGRLSGSSLILTTTDDVRITRPDTGESRWLGAFRITINLETFEAKLLNLNTRRGGRDHPHVVDGRPCFGGHQDTFIELLGRGEIYVAFDLLLQYLETLNLYDEYGRYGSYWFDVPDERPLDTESADAVEAAVA